MPPRPPRPTTLVLPADGPKKAAKGPATGKKRGAGAPKGAGGAPGLSGVRDLVIRGLGLVLAIAFVSYAVQLEGLVGAEGILPYGPWLAAVEAELVADGAIPPPDAVLPGALGGLQVAAERAAGRLAVAPTLAWFLPDGVGAWLLVVAGLVGAAAALTLRLAGPGLLVAWASMLSLVTLGQTFYAFQWDLLLCEATLVALVAAPWGLRPGRAPPPAGVWLLRALFVKLVFLGGLAKLASGDPTWRDGTALAFHFETQPLPSGLAWPAHRLPAWALAVGTYVTHLVELGLVWGALGGRRARLVAFVTVDALMVALAVTGSYGFFQLLTVVLSLALLDDGVLARLRLPTPGHPASRPWAAGVAGLALAAWVGASVAVAWRGLDERPPGPVAEVADALAPWRSVNRYGLFARMTTERPVPVLEARWGAEPWQELTWRWQTSDVRAAPRYAAPHMPRLDWQLWFVGLQGCERAAWTGPFLQAVLAGRDPVVRLVGDLRLQGGRRPDAVRLVTHRLRHAPEGADAWWVRQGEGEVCAAAERAAP